MSAGIYLPPIWNLKLGSIRKQVGRPKHATLFLSVWFQMEPTWLHTQPFQGWSVEINPVRSTERASDTPNISCVRMVHSQPPMLAHSWLDAAGPPIQRSSTHQHAARAGYEGSGLRGWNPGFAGTPGSRGPWRRRRQEPCLLLRRRKYGERPHTDRSARP